jgi:hypothetical protein
MKIVVVIAALALLAGCGEDEEQPAAAPTPAGLAELTVTVEDKSADVRCNAPEDSEVCRAVAKLKPETFAPTPRDVACTQQYGGPETATVTGTLRGETIDAKFSRENGCEIARWAKVEPLLAAAG